MGNKHGPYHAVTLFPILCFVGSSGRKKERARERETRSHARSFLRPLLPSACYAGYVLVTSDVMVYKNPCLLKCHLFSRRCIVDYIQSNLIDFVAWMEKNQLKYRHPKCHLQFRLGGFNAWTYWYFTCLQQNICTVLLYILNFKKWNFLIFWQMC